MNIEGMLNEAKDKAVEEATQKFGPSATPIAEKGADEMEKLIAQRMGINLTNPSTNNDTPPTDQNNS